MFDTGMGTHLLSVRLYPIEQLLQVPVSYMKLEQFATLFRQIFPTKY